MLKCALYFLLGVEDIICFSSAYLGLREKCNLCRLFPASFFPLFLGGLLTRSEQYRLSLWFSGWPSFFHFHRGPTQPGLGRPHDRFSAACYCASCVLQGAARPLGLAALLLRLHSIACVSSLGPTFLFSRFLAFPDGDAKVCVFR